MPILDLSNSEEVARYKEFVASSPYGHVMQSLNWAKVKNNWDSDYVYLQDDAGNITAAPVSYTHLTLPTICSV